MRSQPLMMTIAALAGVASSAEFQPAFPGAEGFGARAEGGRGGKVYHVTTLGDSGAPGTLRHAVEAAGPRTVVFDVSGTIRLREDLRIRNPFITIAGQTAPGGGVCLRDAPLKIEADDVVVRFLRCRPGDEGREGDAMWIAEGHRIIVDHCSASWSTDELVSASSRVPALGDVTVQWCFLTEALNRKNHGFGSLIRGTGGARYSFHHNFYAHNQGRNPRPGNYDSNPHDKDPSGLLLDFRNNLIYNFGGKKAGYNDDRLSVTRLNYVGNTVIPGADSSPEWYSYAIGSPHNRAYFADNLMDGALPDDPWSVVDFRDWNPGQVAAYRQASPFEAGSIITEDPGTAAARVLETGGASLPMRDPVDQRAVQSVRTRTGGIIGSQGDVGGWPELAGSAAPADRDGDGMPDAWEAMNGFNPGDASDGNGDRDGDGYTNLEDYLNGLVSLASSGDYARVVGYMPRQSDKPRVIVTSDGEIDDECSMVRFLLYANEWDVEAIVTSSSQYHWRGHHWAGDRWVEPHLDAYAQVYPSLVQHDARYPAPEYLRGRTAVGNVAAEGDMEEPTAGSRLIVEILLDKSDDRPVWLQAWGGPNTIARALKTIEEEFPDRMAEVAGKIRFFFIWEQDATFQEYIRPRWGKYGIPTIISDQFEALAYRWKDCQPADMRQYFAGQWMTENILRGHGPLCALYRAHAGDEGGFEEGAFRSEGDSPAFLHQVATGLRSVESPGWGGWGGRYVRVRENTWLDPVPVRGHEYPEGRWSGSSAWGRESSRRGATADSSAAHREYFKPIWRWSAAIQNDFASRADWCVKPFSEANHPPVVRLAHPLDLEVGPGQTVFLSAGPTLDPDGDDMVFRWWQHEEADSWEGTVAIRNGTTRDASLTVPVDVGGEKTIHVICEVTDNGTPALTRYQRVVLTVRAGMAGGGGKGHPIERPEGDRVDALRVDLNANGRSDMRASGWENWVPSATGWKQAFGDVTVSLRPAGDGGSMETRGAKALVVDGLTVGADGVVVSGGTPSALEVIMEGLAPGKHTFVGYHHDPRGAGEPYTIASRERVAGGIVPSRVARHDDDLATSFIEFEASAGEPVAIRIAGATGSDLVLNGFAVDVGDPQRKALKPVPANLERHADGDDGQLVLSWQPAASAVRHHVHVVSDPELSVAMRKLAATSGAAPVDGDSHVLSVPRNSLLHHAWRVDSEDAEGRITRGDAWQFRVRQRAFPSAEGYGRFAIGGRGGRVLRVTNLNDSGPGSLREAVEASGPRTVVFDVSGLITLESKLLFREENEFLTIAGQTAPGKGICIRNHTFGGMGARDTIVRFIRLRLGDLTGETMDGMGLAGSDHCIIDHCSISWSIDEAFSSRGAGNITFQRNLISEALNVAGHRKYGEGSAHGYAGSISGNVGSFHHCLLAHNAGRNWSLAGAIDQANRHAGRLDIRNMVVYNWMNRTTDGGAREVNFVNNYYKPGPASKTLTYLNPQFENPSFGPQQYYVAGNVMEGVTAPEGPGGAFKGMKVQGSQDAPTTVPAPFFESHVETDSAVAAFASVLADVGCSVPMLDDHDKRVIRETREGTTTYKGGKSGLPGLPDSQQDVGGWEAYPEIHRPAGWDTDGDGLPDRWESGKGLNPRDASDGSRDPDGDGYTNLEDYLHWLAAGNTQI